MKTIDSDQADVYLSGSVCRYWYIVTVVSLQPNYVSIMLWCSVIRVFSCAHIFIFMTSNAHGVLEVLVCGVLASIPLY